MEKSRNLKMVAASPTEWQLIMPRGGPCGLPPPHGIGLREPDFSSWQIFSKKVVGFMILTRQACIKIHIYVLQTRPLYFRINLQKDEVFKKFLEIQA